MNAVRRLASSGMIFPLVTLIAVWLLPVDSHAQTLDVKTASLESKTSIVGAWTLNKDLSDQTGNDQNGGGSGNGGSGSNRGGGSGGHGGGGGGGGRHGGGMGRGGGGGGSAPAMDPEQAARMRDAMRDLTSGFDHLTITKGETLVVVASSDGRTIRLSPDGKKIKDDNTKIDRKTKWDGDKLVSEIGGLPQGKATQTFVVDPETHQLRIALLMDSGHGQTRTITHVYDFDALNR